jgi:UDP-N-acetyl-D-glucosamine dehydrogenase
MRFCSDKQTLSSIKTLTGLNKYDVVVIVTDHTNIDYKKVQKEANMIVDTRNVFKNIKSNKIVRI